MSSLKGKFTRIKGRFSEARVLPRIGKIRLGVKVERVGPKGTVQFPRETEHFVCPPEVEAVYGPDPTELDVLLPSDDEEVVFQQKLVMYGATAGVKCQGDGEDAERLNEQTHKFEPRTCPCEHLKTAENPRGQCTEKSMLMVMLPTVKMGGCYQITTSSFHSTRRINSALDFTRAVAGRIALLPMKLRRVPQETHHDGKKQTHYVLDLALDATWNQVAALRSQSGGMLIPEQYQIEQPADENPILDPADVTEVEAEDLADASEGELAEIQAKLRAQRATQPSTVQGDGLISSPAIPPAAEAPPPVRQDAPAPKQAQRDGLPSPKESTGVAPPVSITQQVQDASVPKPKPALVDPFKTQAVVKPLTPAQWATMLDYVDSDPDLCLKKQEWKEAHKVDSLNRLIPKGQQMFLDHMRTVPAFPY